MTDVEAFIAELEDGLPVGAIANDGDLAVAITDVALDLPVEGRIEGAALHLSAPRGRLATGFAVPHGRVRVTFVRGDA